MTEARSRAAPSAGVGELAAALASLTPEALGEAVLERTRERLFDTLGATALGLHTPEGRVLRALFGRREIGGRSTALADGCRVCVGATRATEIDDIDIASCTTVGAVVVPVALTLAATRPALDGRTLLTGIVAGYEAMIRLGRAIGGATLLYRGTWPSYVTAPFAAAATSARLLELDAADTERALRIALAASGAPRTAVLGGFALRYHLLGGAAAEGSVAALAAAAGIDAEAGGLEDLVTRIGARLDTAELLDGLGRDWRILDVDTKMFPSSRQALASVEAFIAQTPLPRPLEDLERIAVYVPDAYREMVDRAAPPSQRIESMIGVAYSVALAALEPDALYDVLREPVRRGARLEALAGKVEIHADAGLSARFPRAWGSRVTLHWRDGQETTREVLAPSGSGDRKLGFDTLARKLTRIFAASRVEPAELPRLRARCETVGRHGDAHAALELLAQTARLGGCEALANAAGAWRATS